MIERFRNDPDCRVFLSTDAGSTGLNLQHASTLVNMDLPWNPAVLEQRVARIHRMGQKHPVQIINYVSKGTIEEGMLSVHAFKRSLSAGILDGGSAEVSLGGSRLSRFMKYVENVTGRMGDGEAMAPSEEAGQVAEMALAASSDAATTEPDANADGTATLPHAAGTDQATAAAAAAEPWSGLLRFGAELAAALSAPDGGAATTHPWVERDPATGARSLKVPLPAPDTGKRIADALALLADALLGAGNNNR